MITEFMQKSQSGVVYYEDPKLGDSALRHGFATRKGGVSTAPHLASMNLGFFRGEPQAITQENHARFAAGLGIPPAQLVFANQTHTHTVYTVTAAHHGVGVTKPPVYLPGTDPQDPVNEVDALVTAQPGVALGIRVADCVPLLFYDPVAHIIGAAHAGWRGTLDHIAPLTLYTMEEAGAHAPDVRVAIGPSIGACCYTVDHAFYEKFLQQLGTQIWAAAFSDTDTAHPRVSLARINEELLTEAGVLPEHIHTTSLCTCCSPAIFHSHRATGGKRGTGGALIWMQP